MLIDPTNQQISITRQCQLVGLHRSNYYYQYQGVTESVEILMRLIDERYTAYPCEGSRRIMKWLNRQGHDVTRDQVRYLMDKMGLQAIYLKPNTSARSRQ
jgi:putative transposase